MLIQVTRIKEITGRLLAALFCVVGATSAVPAERWVEIQSPNFTVVSSAGAEEAKEVARQFEQFRLVIQGTMPQLSLDPGQPIVILAVPNIRQLRTLLPHFWEKEGRVKPAGVFVRGPERHFVVLRLDVQDVRPFQTIYHEYFHLLVSLNLPWAPLWLNEGLAEFYANTEFRDRDVVFGLPNFSHVGLLRKSQWLPIGTLLSAEEESSFYDHADTASIFYSQSWALLHYLMLEDSRNSTEHLPRLLELLERGLPADRAVREALGDLQRLQERLEKYIRDSDFFYYQYPEPVVVESDRFGVRWLVPGESEAIRASFLIRSDRHSEAKRLIDQALGANPSLALAHESLGNLLYAQGRTEEALSAFAKAIDLNSQSYLSQYLFGYLSLEILGRLDKKTESSLRKAIQLRPTFPYSYSALATLLLKRGSGPDEAVDLARRATDLEPNNPQLLHTLAYALSLQGELSRAEKVLARVRQLAAGSSRPQFEDTVAQLTEYLETQRLRRQELLAMEEERRVIEGSQDQGLETIGGKVQTVRCSAPASMEMVLATPDGLLTLDSKNFTAVKFLFRSPPSPDFHPCSGLEGKAITVEFQPDPDATRNRIVQVRLN